jgi:predicted permease
MHLGQDIRFALRMLRKTPALTVVAVLALGLGIGANTAIFSLVNAVLLRPLPFPHPEQLVEVVRQYKGGYSDNASIPAFLDWRRQATTLTGMAGYETGNFNLAGSNAAPQRVPGFYVDTNFFQLLGIQMAHGGGFQPSDDEVGRPAVAIISDGLWRTRFNANPNMVGEAVRINDQSVPIVGVLPAGFHFATSASDVFEPLQPEGVSQDRGANLIHVVGRIRPSIALAAAQSQVTAVGDRLGKLYAKTDGGHTIGLIPLQRYWSGNVRPALLMLFAAVGLVLLIACGDLANLLLAKASGRRREIAVRLALGAERRRIVAQLLTESVVLALLGGAAGLALGWAGLRGLLAIVPVQVQQQLPVHAGMSGAVLLFTLALAVVTGILFGWAPALQVSHTKLNTVLQQEGGGAGGGRHRLRRLLIVGELALALPLLIGAGLLIASLIRLRTVDAGFKADHLLTAQIPLAPSRYKATSDVANLVTRLLPQIRALPGVQSAALTFCLPGECGPDLPFQIIGRSFNPKDVPDATYLGSSGQIFAAMGALVLHGRGIGVGDTATSQPVAVINQAAVKQWWPHQDPIGQSIWIGKGEMGPALTDAAPRTIVGVVGDVREYNLTQPAGPAVYVPLSQIMPGAVPLLAHLEPLALMVRTAGAPDALSRAVQTTVSGFDPDQPLSQVLPMEEVEAGYAAPQRFNLELLSLFAVLALVLAALGVYGVMSYAVAQRTHEIGLRMALGATPQTVLRLVLGEGVRLALAGIGIGIAVALALSRVVSRFLFGVKSWDPAIFALTALLLLLVAAFACWLPARRAAQLDPWKALRLD